MRFFSPLTKFGFHLFTYLRNYNDGSQIYLCSNPQWTLDYYTKALYKSSLFEQRPDAYQDGFISWPAAQKNLAVFKHGREFYQSIDGITYTEQHNNYREFFFFSCDKDNFVSTFAANNIEILNRFILYFKAEAELLLKKAEKHTITLPNRFTDFDYPSNEVDSFIYKTYSMVDAKKEFYNQTRIQKYRFEKGALDGIKLSNQELECIAHLLNYKTIKEIAKKMSISPRTVETYLNNIKIKLNCDSKSDIITVLLQQGFDRQLLITE